MLHRLVIMVLPVYGVCLCFLSHLSLVGVSVHMVCAGNSRVWSLYYYPFQLTCGLLCVHVCGVCETDCVMSGMYHKEGVEGGWQGVLGCIGWSLCCCRLLVFALMQGRRMQHICACGITCTSLRAFEGASAAFCSIPESTWDCKAHCSQGCLLSG